MPIVDCDIHPSVKIWHPGLVNLYGCTIGAHCRIGAFVEIGKGVPIGEQCKIESHAFIPEGVIIGKRCFIGPHVAFCNVKFPMRDENYKQTIVSSEVRIGAGSIILSGIKLNMGAFIGAGSVVVHDVEPGITVVGNPAKPIEHYATDCKYFLFGEICSVRRCGETACKGEDYET